MWKKLKQAFKSSKEKNYHKEVSPPSPVEQQPAEPDKLGLSRPRGNPGRPSLDVGGRPVIETNGVGLTGAGQHGASRRPSSPSSYSSNVVASGASANPASPTANTVSSHRTATESSSGGASLSPTTSSIAARQHSSGGTAQQNPLLKPTCPSSAIKLTPSDLEPHASPHLEGSAAASGGSSGATSPSSVAAAGAAAAAVSATAAGAKGSKGGSTGGVSSDGGGENGGTTASGSGSSSSKGPEPNHTPRDVDLQGCPPYATKAVWGLRYTMEDKWAAVPNLVQVPAIYTSVPQGRNLSDAAAAACSCIKRGSHKSSERQPIMGPDDEDMDSLHYFGVFDGHGGADAAKFCASRMHAVVLEEINAALAASSSNKAVAPTSTGEWMSATLMRAFVSLDKEFAAISEGTYVGTTAVVVVLGRQRMWVAHCGDSRCVLSRNGDATALTQDHKANRDDEVARVQAAGGHVWWDRVMGELAVSRAIGDHCLRPYVIPEPEVSMLDCTPKDEVLVLASDGLWDVMGNQEAADMALHSLVAAETQGLLGVAAVKKASAALTKAALDRGTRDNVTVLVVDLRNHP